MSSVGVSDVWLPETRSQKSGKESKIEVWWEVKRSDNPADPKPTRGATPLVERCMRVHGYKEGFAKRVLKGYRQFMELKSVMNDWNELKLAPSVPINNMWEQHLLDNLNYTEDCMLLFGRVIGHNPDSILDTPALRDRITTTKIAFQARYGDDLDQEVWDFGDSWSAPSRNANNGDNWSPPARSSAGMKSPEVTNLSMMSEPQAVSSPRGRLPVAAVAGETMSPVSHRHSSAVSVESAEEASSPITNRGHGNLMSSPPRSARSSSSQPRAAAASSKAASKLTSPAANNGNEPITIFLRDQNTGEETYFSLRFKSTLRIVFTVFAERRGLDQSLLKFSFNGQTLTGYETPHSLGLEDRARIDVLINQRRG